MNDERIRRIRKLVYGILDMLKEMEGSGTARPQNAQAAAPADPNAPSEAQTRYLHSLLGRVTGFAKREESGKRSEILQLLVEYHPLTRSSASRLIDDLRACLDGRKKLVVSSDGSAKIVSATGGNSSSASSSSQTHSPSQSQPPVAPAQTGFEQV